MSDTKLHPTGLNIINNADGSFAFEWDPKDERWSWMNDLTDDQIQTIIEELVKEKNYFEELINDQQSLGGNERS